MKTFTLTDGQIKKAEEWQKQHVCPSTCHIREEAIFISPISFVFNENSLLTEVKIRCICGAEFDLTEWEKA